jgi:hypothetical protein
MKGIGLSIKTVILIVLGLLVVAALYGAFDAFVLGGDGVIGTFLDNIVIPSYDGP